MEYKPNSNQNVKQNQNFKDDQITRISSIESESRRNIDENFGSVYNKVDETLNTAPKYNSTIQKFNHSDIHVDLTNDSISPTKPNTYYNSSDNS